MSSAFLHRQQQYVWPAASGYLFLAASLVTILVVIVGGRLW